MLMRTTRHTVFGDGPSSTTPQQVSVGVNLTWPEGPVYTKSDRTLVFSDTITGRMYRFSVAAGTVAARGNAGDCPDAELAWRAEPGSNGLAQLRVASHDADAASQTLVVCQHGARRLVLLNMDGAFAQDSMPVVPLATHYNGRRLNGPNDVVVRREKDGTTWAYFTDPVYAWLEQDRFSDLPYLDQAVQEKGPGACGVYRVEVPANVDTAMEGARHAARTMAAGSKTQDEAGGKTRAEAAPTTVGAAIGGSVERVAIMRRPNGLAFWGDSLIVSDCCQGSHVASCTQGTARWTVFDHDAANGAWTQTKVITDTHMDADGMPSAGCADGFKVDPLSGLVVASCPGGVCVVDIDAGKVVARLLTTTAQTGFKVSNVAFAEQERRLFMTTGAGVFSLPLGQRSSRRGSTRQDEL